MSAQKGGSTISAPQPEVMDSTEDAGFGGCSFLSRIAGGIGEPSGHTGGRDSFLGMIAPATPLIRRDTLHGRTVARSTSQAMDVFLHGNLPKPSQQATTRIWPNPPDSSESYVRRGSKRSTGARGNYNAKHVSMTDGVRQLSFPLEAEGEAAREGRLLTLEKSLPL